MTPEIESLPPDLELSQMLRQAFSRNLVFVHGKGGVGKTVISQAISNLLAKKSAQVGSKTLWVTIEDPTQIAGELKEYAPGLWHLNCDFTAAFEEYAAMKIGASPLTKLFLQNKVIRYLAKAAPGVHELVLLGKVWFERKNYDHVIVDLPSTGYGLAMFQSTENFSRLFRSGPLYRDAEEMLDTFRDPNLTTHLVVGLPEEMPLRESIELRDYLSTLFPKNPAVFLVNRLFPGPVRFSDGAAANTTGEEDESPDSPHSWSSPLAKSGLDYVMKRFQLESHNLRLWREAGIKFGRLEYVAPVSESRPGPAFASESTREESFRRIIDAISRQLQARGYL